MSFQADHLEKEYIKTIVSGRRNQDAIWDFLHFDSPKRASWIADLLPEAEREFGEFLTPWDWERMAFIGSMEPHNAQYALWFGAVTLFPAMCHFLCASDELPRVHAGLWVQFIEQRGFDLVQGWLEGQFHDTHSFVRHVRKVYVTTVPCLSYSPLSSSTALQLSQ